MSFWYWRYSPKKRTKKFDFSTNGMYLKSFFGELKTPKKIFQINWPLVRGKYNQIAAFWNPIVCMIYMAAVLIQLLTLKHLLHFLYAIIKYAESLQKSFTFCSSTYLNSKSDKNVGKSPNECWIMIWYHKRHQPDVIQIIFK